MWKCPLKLTFVTLTENNLIEAVLFYEYKQTNKPHIFCAKEGRSTVQLYKLPR